MELYKYDLVDWTSVNHGYELAEWSFGGFYRHSRDGGFAVLVDGVEPDLQCRRLHLEEQ